MCPTFKALFGATLVVILCGAEPAPGQSLGFESLAAARVGSAPVVATLHVTSPTSTSQIELPGTISVGITLPENLGAGGCPPGDLVALDTAVSLTPFAGFFQEDGVVNCQQVTLFDRFAELGAKPYAFAAAAGTLTFITLKLLQEDKTPARGVTAGEIITPVPEPATLLLSALSVLVMGVAAKMRRRRR